MNPWLRRGLQVVSLVLFGLILWWAGPEAWRQVASGDPTHLVIALLLLGLATMVSAARLQLVAVSIAGLALPNWSRFYHLTMTTRALGLIIPRSVSILAGKSVGLRAFGVPLRRAAWIVVMDNVFDLAFLAVLVVPALIFLQRVGSVLLPVALAFCSILLLAGLVWWFTAHRRWQMLLRWLSRVPKLRSSLHLDDEGSPAPLPQAAAVKVLGLTILLNAALVLCYYHVGRAVGLSHPWSIFAAGYPITQLSLVLAFTPGGLGLFDASWYGILLFGGVAQQDALNFVVAQRAYVLVFVLLWAGVSVLLTFLAERRAHA